jgi:hypothetical protein
VRSCLRSLVLLLINVHGRSGIFGARPVSRLLPIGRACLDCGPQEAKTGDRASERAVDEQAAKEHIDRVAAAIDDRLEKISRLKVYEIDREYLARDAEARSFSLPPADATDKLLRYEAHLDRQLYRAMDQLERIQRQRRGENVPPPLNINLGRRR